MEREKLTELLSMIEEPDKQAQIRAEERWNSVAKPLHSLGLLEEAVIRISGMTGSENIDIGKRCVVDFCADNGVVCEGVTQSDSSVTSVVALEMARGRSNINTLAKVYNADVKVVDVGIKSDITHENIIPGKVSFGTENIVKGPAMTVSQAEEAVGAGMDIVLMCKNEGYKILVTGEMGIGNTTTSSAIASVMLGLPPEKVTGRGAGLSDDGLKRKINAIKCAIDVNAPDKTDPMGVLSKLGGYDIAAMTGMFLGGALYHVPVVIDGFISAAAALIAFKVAPLSRDYMLCSHVSDEPAGEMILKELGLRPVITGNMRLGEGAGGVMLLPLLDGALAVYNSAHRFEELPIERYVDI